MAGVLKVRRVTAAAVVSVFVAVTQALSSIVRFLSTHGPGTVNY